MFKNIIRIVLVLVFCSIAFGQTIEYHGVCVGINYPGEEGLQMKYCVADAEGIRTALENYQSWLDGNITMKEDANATRQNIINAVSTMPRNSTNIVLF